MPSDDQEKGTGLRQAILDEFLDMLENRRRIFDVGYEGAETLTDADWSEARAAVASAVRVAGTFLQSNADLNEAVSYVAHWDGEPTDEERAALGEIVKFAHRRMSEEEADRQSACQCGHPEDLHEALGTGRCAIRACACSDHTARDTHSGSSPELGVEAEVQKSKRREEQIAEAAQYLDSDAEDCENMAAEQDEAGDKATREWHRGQADAYRQAAEKLRNDLECRS